MNSKIAKLSAVTGISLSLGLGITTIVVSSANDSHNSTEITNLQSQINDLHRTIDNLQSVVSGLQITVSGLSRPTDPLAAYDQECSQYFTNNATGNQNLYYFPCTNNVVTIPQP